MPDNDEIEHRPFFSERVIKCDKLFWAQLVEKLEPTERLIMTPTGGIVLYAPSGVKLIFTHEPVERVEDQAKVNKTGIQLKHFDEDPACLYRMVDEEFKRIEASHVIPNPEQKMCIRTHKDTVSFKDMPVGAEWVCPSCGDKWFKILNMGKPAWANR